jgi:hypothetical protein
MFSWVAYYLLKTSRNNRPLHATRREFPRHTVTSGVTTARKAEKSQLPSDGTIRVRIIGAEVTSFDPGSQVVTEGWDCVADFLDGIFDTFCYSRTRSFGVRGSLAVPAPQSDGGCKIVRDRLHLILRLGVALRIFESLCLVQLLAQLVEPALIFCFRLCIQHWDTRMRLAPCASMQDDCCSRS